MLLEVYIPRQHPGRQEALDIIRQARHIPGLQVVVSRVDEHITGSPIISTAPSYWLDGQLLAWGQPAPRPLLAELHRLVETSAASNSSQPENKRPASSQACPTSSATQEGISSWASFPLTAALKPEEIAALQKKLTLRTFTKGRFIYRQGEPARELFLLKQGQVQLSRLTTAGKRIGLALIRPGMFFGAVPQGDEARQVCFAEVIEDAQVGVLGAVAIKQIISEQPAVTSLIINDLIQQIQLLVERLEAFAFYDAPTKLVIELLRLAHEKHTTKLAITHQQLGELTGLLRETVTKLLDAFQEEGLVELHRGQIVLRDMAGLHARQGIPQAKELFPITRLALQQPETVN